MTRQIKHPFTNPKSDGGDATIVRPSNWNADHDIALKLDELDAPTDITTLNATASLHGLLPKLSGNAADFLTGAGTWRGRSAAALVQTASDADNAATTTPVLGAAPTVGNILIALVCSTGNSITSLVQTNVTWTELVSASNGSALKVAIWKGVIASGAGTTLTVNGSTFLACRLYEFTTLAGTLVQSASYTDGGTGAGAVTKTIYPTAGNMVFGIVGFDSGGTIGHPLFVVTDDVVSNFLGAGYTYANPFGTAMQWGGAPNIWASIIAEIS